MTETRYEIQWSGKTGDTVIVGIIEGGGPVALVMREMWDNCEPAWIARVQSLRGLPFAYSVHAGACDSSEEGKARCQAVVDRFYRPREDA